jgi:phosphotransacetylase
VALVRSGEAGLLMKGSLHTDELLGAVVSKDTGLRTGRRLSHVFLMDVPAYHKLLMVTDAAINIVPTLEDKRDICRSGSCAGHRATQGRHSVGSRDRDPANPVHP